MRDYKLENKKELIRKAAIEVISKEGFHHATSDKIAAEAGISVGTIYNYFENKEAILGYIFEIEYQKRARLLEELKNSSLHPIFKIVLMLHHHFEHVKQDDKVTKIVLRDKHLPFTVKDGVKKFGGMPKFFEDVLNEGLASGQIDTSNPQVLATIIFGIVEGVINIYVLEKELGVDTEILEQALLEIDNLLWRGLPKTERNLLFRSKH